MLRYLLALLIVAANFAPTAAFAQNETEAVNTATNTTTNTTTQTTETTNTATNTADTNTNGDAQDGDRERPPANLDRSALDASGEALLRLFVLAVILESALALLFNWRPFIARYDGRGVKAPISLAAALFLVFAFEPDTIAKLMDGYGREVNSAGRFFARVIEAMVIAGGAAGVNRLLVALGFRSVTRAQEVVARPKRDEAWLSIGLDRQKAVGPVLVELTIGDAKPAIAGTIAGTRAVKRSYFRRDYGRLPPAGGIPVPLGKPVSVRLVDQAKNASDTWGPYSLAEGAIVDIDLTL